MLTMGKNKKGGQKPKGQSPTAKLELPEGYSPNKSKMPRRGKGKQAKAIEKAERDAERSEAGLPPLQQSRYDKSKYALLQEMADELGIELDPHAEVRLLVFNEAGRKWRSLSVKPHDFMKWYEGYQNAKCEPKVFACETPSSEDEDKKKHEAQFIVWFQQNRYHYYHSQGRLRQLQALENVKDWPNMPGLMTKAPFVRTDISEHKFVENTKNRARGIFKVLNVPDIARAVLKQLAKIGYLDLSNISRTCHTGLNIVSKYIEHWDETPPGDFLGEDIALDDQDKVQRTPVTLLISPIRKDFNFKDGKRPDIKYAEHLLAQVKLYRALKNRAALITNLQLHRIHFLDLNAVRCILESLQNLEIIGIYQCQLLHLGNMFELLDVVEKSGRRKEGDRSFVDLDFFPMFHEGPNSILRHGSYGAVWNHPDCDMATGIWQLVLYVLYPKARSLDIDILSWGRAFRLFLEKLPMRSWAVVRIIEAIKSFEFSRKSRTELVMTAYNKSEGKWERFVDDVTAALRGDNNELALVPGCYLTKGGYQPDVPRKYGWWRETKLCTTCRVNIPAVFCPFTGNRCWGCLAKQNLTEQYDHHMSFKVLAAKTWFGRCRNLDDIVNAGFHEEAYLIAQNMDKYRRLEMENEHGTDKTDWVYHADFDRLHRRYARKYESHGPVDRKLNDRQYYPIGHFDSPITSDMVPKDYPEFKLAIWMQDWDAKRKQSHPDESETQRAQARQKFRDESTKRMENTRAGLIDEQNKKDASEVETARSDYKCRQRFANWQVKCWDELTQDMFARSNAVGKNGKPLELPYWLREKRPTGALK